MTTNRIPLVDLRRDGGTQVRETMNAATVQDYADALAEGAEFPAVTVFFDGEAHWLADGFHRVLAHERAGLVDVLAEVRAGSKRDALRFALSANRGHGLQMSGPDKRRAVEIILADEEWRGWSDRAIAKEVGVSPTTVAKVKGDMGWPTVQTGQLATPTKGLDGKTRPVPGEATDKVRAFLADPANAVASNRAVAKELNVSKETVAKVRWELEDKKVSDADLVKGQTLCDTLVEIGAAKDGSALGTINGTIANRPLSDDGREQVERAIQRRCAELREQGRLAALRAEGECTAQDLDLTGEDADLGAIQQGIDEEAARRRNAREQAPAPTPTAPTDAQGHLFTQAAMPKPETAAVATEVIALRAEVESLRAELSGLRRWSDEIASRAGAADEGSVKKAMHLVALAGSDNENEARSAAYQACRVIREKGLLVATTFSPDLAGDTTDLDELRRSNATRWAKIWRDLENMSRGVQS